MSNTQVFATALKRYQAGEYPHAEMLCHESLAADPREIDAWNLMGVVMYLTGRKELALHHLYEAVRLRPDFADAYSNLGNVLRELGRTTDAIAMYERRLKRRQTMQMRSITWRKSCGNPANRLLPKPPTDVCWNCGPIRRTHITAWDLR